MEDIYHTATHIVEPEQPEELGYRVFLPWERVTEEEKKEEHFPVKAGEERDAVPETVDERWEDLIPQLFHLHYKQLTRLLN